MTVSVGTYRSGPYTGNGVATSFAFDFKVFAKADVRVILTEIADAADEDLVLDSDYSITLNPDQDSDPGGTITYPLAGDPMESTHRLTAASNLTIRQPLDITNLGGFYPQTQEDAFDRAVILIGQLDLQMQGAMRLPLSAPSGTSTELPLPESRHLAVWNEDATALESISVVDLATIVSYGTAHADIFSGDGVTTVFTLSNNPGALNNLDVSIGGVAQKPGDDYTWVDGTALTFASAPPVGTRNVLVRYMQALPQGTIDSASTSFAQGGAGAVIRTVQTKLREVQVSAEDYTSIQEAIDAVYEAGGGVVDLVAKTYTPSSPITMKRGVTLRGPRVRVSVNQTYEYLTDPEAEIKGAAIIRPTSAVTTEAIHFDFDSTEAERPYGTRLEYLMLDCADMVSGHGIHFEPGGSGGGIFENGAYNDECGLDNVIVLNAPTHGVYVNNPTLSAQVNGVYLDHVYAAFCGGSGLHIKNAFDTRIRRCFSYHNDIAGLYLEGSQVTRVQECDFFNNLVTAETHSGSGIVDDGLNNSYVAIQCDTNKGHGVKVVADTYTNASRNLRFTGCRSTRNGLETTNTYANFHIGDNGTTGLGGINFIGCVFGEIASGAIKVAYEIQQTLVTTQIGNSMVGCIVKSNDLQTATAPFSDEFWKSTYFAGSTGPAGNELQSKPYDIAPWVGNAAPNVLRGVNFYKTANVGAASMSGLSTGDAVIGREVVIWIGDANTTIDFSASNLYGNSGVDYAAPANTVLRCKNLDGTKWAVEVVKPS